MITYLWSSLLTTSKLFFLFVTSIKKWHTDFFSPQKRTVFHKNGPKSYSYTRNIFFFLSQICNQWDLTIFWGTLHDSRSKTGDFENHLVFSFLLDCKPTDPNKPCVFPFRYESKWYSKCTTSNHDKPWCSTYNDTYYGGNHTGVDYTGTNYASGSWGNCDSNNYVPYLTRIIAFQKFFLFWVPMNI